MIKRLKVKNYKTIRDLEIYYTPGIFGLMGRNGVGKSSLLSSLYFAISGDPLGKDKKKDVLTWGEKKGYVLLELCSKDITYTIERFIPGVKTVLTSSNKQENKILKEFSVAEINEFVLKKLGNVAPSILSSVVFAEQGRIESMLDCTPSERLDQMIKIFHLHEGEKLREQYQDQLSALSSIDIPTYEERLRQVRLKADVCRNTAKEHQALAEGLEKKLKDMLSGSDKNMRRAYSHVEREIEQISNMAEESLSKVASILEKKAKAIPQEYIEQARSLKDSFSRWLRERKPLKEERKNILQKPPREGAEEILEDTKASLTGIIALIKSIKKGVCLTCGNKNIPKLDIHKETNKAKEIKESIKVLEQEVKALRRLSDINSRLEETFNLEGVNSKVLTLMKAESIPSLSDSKEALQSLYDKYNLESSTLIQQVQELEEELKTSIPDRDYEASRKKTSEIEELSKEISDARAEQASLLKEASHLDTQTKDITQEIEDAKEDSLKAEVLKRCREVLHRENLPRLAAAKLVEDIAPRMASYSSMLNIPYPVKFTPGLDIVYVYEGEDRPFRALSGGQKVAVSIAFRLALVDVMAGDVGLLVLDEPTAHLDEDVVSCFTEVLKKVEVLVKKKNMIVKISTHEKELERAFTSITHLGEKND